MSTMSFASNRFARVAIQLSVASALVVAGIVWKRRRNTKKGDEKVQKVNERGRSVRLVLQRFRSASLLVDGSMVSVGGEENGNDSKTSCGLLVYISFAKPATKKEACQAATIVVNSPLLTSGKWGDGSTPMSLLDMASAGSTNGVNLLLVPQANLISKVKNQGRSIQYHDQIEKEKGEALYNDFVTYTKALVAEQQYKSRNEPIPERVSDLLGEKKAKISPTLPPEAMFRDTKLYSEWDAEGLPTKDSQGQSLSRSVIKKLKKRQASQQQRYQKFLSTGGAAESNGVESPAESSPIDLSSLLDESFVKVIPGSFGALQGLEMKSDMGPFCHVTHI